jgi:hypothetical protein
MGASDLYYDLVEFLRTTRHKLHIFSSSMRFKRKTGKPFDIRDTLARINYYRRIREWCVSHYLSKTVALGKKDKDILITWQPLVYVCLKISLALFAGFALFGFYPEVGRVVEQLIHFFRLHEIYNFDMPGPVMFDAIGQVILAIVIVSAGFSFAVRQLTALFSSFVVNPLWKKAYYIKNILIRKELYVFSLPEIEHCILTQSIPARLFGIGTLELRKKSGYTVRIASVKNAPLVMRYLLLAKDGVTGAR